MKKFDLSMLSIAILVLALAIVGVALKPPEDPVIATVGKSQITQGQIYGQMKELYGKKVLSLLVSRNLVVEEAKALGVSVPEEEVNQHIKNVREQVGSEEVFQQMLKSQGYTEESFRSTLRTLMLRDKVFEKYYPVTDQEVQDFYNKYKNKFESQGLDLEQARTEIVDELTAAKRDEYLDKWLDDLEKKFGVQYLDQSLSLKKKEPKAEEQKPEESKKEEPKTEAPKTEAPKTETPKSK
ncbi:SurA N-terminal domain-containing protein [Brevibacillus borstelensis]|uniref:SurA N-terminal domain-containing protein n=1 Tax=Brevibacillus borstelensis TaxID=45462 RepID=UPI0030BCAFB5